MKARKINLIIFSIFFLLCVIFIYPLSLGINTYIPAFHSTDESYGALWNFWWLKYIHLNNLSLASCALIAAPFGMADLGSGYPLWNFINKWLSLLTNNVFAYNLEVFFGFLAAGVFMYCLFYYFSESIPAGIFAGIIYAFCPYHFVRAWQHLGLSMIQWMPFYLWSLFKLKDAPNWKNILWVTLSLFLVFSFDLYYAYFMLLATAVFIIFLLAYRLKVKLKEPQFLKNDLAVIKKIILSGFLVLVLVMPTIYLTFKNKAKYKGMLASAHNPYVRPFEDLFSQSARPLSYLLPATSHPIFGKFTDNFIGTPWYGESFTEHTLYLGWVPLIFAFVALRRWRKRQGQPSLGTVPFGDSPYYRENFYIGFFIFLAVAAWFFSQPPWWKLGPIKIYMPSFFMYKVLPMYRAYCRFGIVVMLAVAVLAGFGLKFILEKFKSQKTKIALTCLFSGLILFEFWNWPPYKVIDVSKVPQVYYWLKEQPRDIVIAEYPLDADSPNEMYKFYQTVHEKKIINGTIPGTYANKVAQTIRKLSESNTTGTLKRMGVRYVLVHREDYLKTELTEEIEEVNKVPFNPGLKFIKGFPAQECPQKDIMCVQKTGPIDIYEVVTDIAIEPKFN